MIMSDNSPSYSLKDQGLGKCVPGMSIDGIGSFSYNYFFLGSIEHSSSPEIMYIDVWYELNMASCFHYSLGYK